MHNSKVLVTGISLGWTAEEWDRGSSQASLDEWPRRARLVPIGQCAMATSVLMEDHSMDSRCACQDCLIRCSHSGYATATAAACRAGAGAEDGVSCRIWYRGARPSVNPKLCSCLYDVFVPRRTSPRTSIESAVFPAFASTVESSPPCSNLLNLPFSPT